MSLSTINLNCWNRDCDAGIHAFPRPMQVIRVKHHAPLQVVASNRSIIVATCDEMIVKDIDEVSHQVRAVPVRQSTPTEVWVPIDLIDFTA